MPEFEYRGIGPQDIAVEGQISAANHDQANKLLQEMQVRVSELRTREVPPPSVKPVSHADFVMLNEQLVAMVKAGVPLEEGFRNLAEDLARPRLRNLVNELAEDLASGTSLEEAIRKRHQAFPTLYAQIIAVGMKTGRLAVVLAGFNRYLEFVGAIRRTVWESINYPLVILIIGLAVLWWTTQMVAPGFRVIFTDFGTDLPVPTKLALKLSDNLRWLFPTVLITAATIFILIRSARGPTARRVKENIVLTLPVVGNMQRQCLIARFTQGLSVMVRAGIPLEEAVLMAGEATGSPAVISDCRRTHDALSRGQPISQALQTGRILPRFLGQTVKIATDRNQVESILEELSRLYDQRAQQGLSLLRAVLMPMMVCFLGVTIGGFIMAMFLPLVKLISSVSGGK